jgi:7-cyano-7-deazaguanine synthase
MRQSALVLFSGGQDSTVCLAWALQRFSRVETVGFFYGQRHAVELECRQDIMERLRALRPDWDDRLGRDHVLNASVLAEVSDTALTQEKAIEVRASGLPNTFVPGRNILFLTLAAALAYRRDLQALVGGMCETDYSGYPDCRDDTLKAVQVALSLGLGSRLVVETPLMWLDKQATWNLTHEIGGDALVELVREATHTCYVGDRTRRNEWGHGCGDCPACELRRKGYEAFVQSREQEGADASK